MVNTRRHPTLTRYAAPIAFLAAVTVAVLIVREGLSDGSGTAGTRVTAVETVETTPATTTAPGPDAEATLLRDQGRRHARDGRRQFDTTVEQLLVLNPDVDPVALGIGERIRVK